MAPGELVGHYRIVERRGAGGMGVVYQAIDTRLNRRVALKVLNADKTADTVRRQRFIQEAQAASALDHPNIVTVYDIPEINGSHVMVMQYVEGKSLGELIQRGPLRIDDALRYAIQIADALAQAHARNIVHRDLKPDNVMVTPEGQAKVLDFGLAKLMPAGDSEETMTATMDRPHTDPGLIVGTAGYMSPEQAQGKTVDARTDIFAFGALLYEMVTGKRAFRGDTRMSILAAVIRDEPQRISIISPAVPQELERIIARALRKDPERRWQSMADIRVALLEVREESQSGAAHAPAPARPRMNRRAGAVIAGAAVLLAGAAFWIGRGRLLKSAGPLHTFPLTGALGREVTPAFSPDGNQIVYAGSDTEIGQTHIYVKLIGAGTPLQLTNAPRGSDSNPVWSPDGRYIAFERQVGQTRDIYLVPALGGVERRVANNNYGHGGNEGLSWSPDGKSIAAVTQIEGSNDGIILVSVDSGAIKVLAKPPQGVLGFSHPVFSQDGKWLAFNYRQGASYNDVFLQKIGSTDPPRRLTSEHRVIQGLTWTQDGRAIVFSSNHSGVAALWRVPLDGGKPERVADTGENATFPAIPPQGGRLAYATVVSDTNIWRAPLDQDRRAGDSVRIIASSRDDRGGHYSPDEKHIAFVSERSGTPQIWISDADGANPRMITSFDGGNVYGPRYSPDGALLLFDMFDDSAGGFRQVQVMPAEGGPRKRITSDLTNLFNCTWSRDGKWIYYYDTAEPIKRIYRIPAAGGQKVPVSPSGGALAMESPDGKYLYYTKRPGRGLFRMPLPSGEETQVDDDARENRWDVAPDGVYLLKGNGISFLSFATLKLTPVAENVADEHHDVHEFSVSPAAHWLLYTRHDRNEATIQVVEGFR